MGNFRRNNIELPPSPRHRSMTKYGSDWVQWESRALPIHHRRPPTSNCLPPYLISFQPSGPNVFRKNRSQPTTTEPVVSLRRSLLSCQSLSKIPWCSLWCLFNRIGRFVHPSVPVVINRRPRVFHLDHPGGSWHFWTGKLFARIVGILTTPTSISHG